MTHYERLGIGPDASPAEVREAFRRAVNALHPDRHGDENTADMAEVNQAWWVLSDPARRAAYDAGLQREAEARRRDVAPAPVRDPGPDDNYDGPPGSGGRTEGPVARLRSLVVIWGVVGAALVGMLFLYGFCRSGAPGG